MLIELAESYVRALNGGKVPTIENAWNYVQASELERAFKETVQEYDSKIRGTLEKTLPLSNTDLNNQISLMKQEVFKIFKSKCMGDINNAKGIEYMDKLKKDFKNKVEQLKKKNAQFTKDTVIKALENCYNNNLKAKVSQGLYKNYSDIKFDFEQLRNEIL